MNQEDFFDHLQYSVESLRLGRRFGAILLILVPCGFHPAQAHQFGTSPTIHKYERCTSLTLTHH